MIAYLLGYRSADGGFSWAEMAEAVTVVLMLNRGGCDGWFYVST